MQEKHKKPIEGPSPGPSGFDFGFDDGSSDPLSVNVGSGGYNENLPVAGKTVGEIRKKFKTRMEIDDAAVPVINGKDADEDSIVSQGCKLQFIHKAGEKGAVVSVVDAVIYRLEKIAKQNDVEFVYVIYPLPGGKSGSCFEFEAKEDEDTFVSGKGKTVDEAALKAEMEITEAIENWEYKEEDIENA